MGDCAVSLQPCVSAAEAPILREAQDGDLLAQVTPVRPPDVAPAGNSRAERTPPAFPSKKDLALARDHFKRGQKLFRKGKFLEARGEFEKAFGLSGKPKLLYNIALCHQKLGKDREAVASYRAYLKALPDAPNRKDVEVEIVLLEKKLAADETVAMAADPTLPPLVPLPPPARDDVPTDYPDPPPLPGFHGAPSSDALVPPPPAGVTEKTEAATAPPPYKQLMFTSGAIAAVGLITTGWGIYMSRRRESEHADLVLTLRRNGRVTERSGQLAFANPDVERKFLPKLNRIQDEGELFEGIGWGAGIGSGVFLALTGVFWWLTPDQPPSLNVAVDSGKVYVALERRF